MYERGVEKRQIYLNILDLKEISRGIVPLKKLEFWFKHIVFIRFLNIKFAYVYSSGSLKARLTLG